jgi:hypothetical protein
MPVEIKELVIRAIATSDRSARDDDSPSMTSEEKEALIEQCARRVLQVLKNAKER